MKLLVTYWILTIAHTSVGLTYDSTPHVKYEFMQFNSQEACEGFSTALRFESEKGMEVKRYHMPTVLPCIEVQDKAAVKGEPQ